MGTFELVSTADRARLLEHLLFHLEGEINFNRIAKKLGLARSFVFKYVKILGRNGIVRRGKISGDDAFVRQMKVMINLERLRRAGMVGLVRKNIRKVRGIGVYGSWATGTNAAESDLDIWVKFDSQPEELEIARARHVIEGRIKADVDITELTPEKVTELRAKSETFYFSLFHSIVLFGEGL